MGIYSNGKVFGFNFAYREDNADEVKIHSIFKKVSPKELTKEEIHEAYEWFKHLTDCTTFADRRNYYILNVYTECSSSYGRTNQNTSFKEWIPIGCSTLKDWFEKQCRR